MADPDRDILIEFLELYKELSCLWDTNSPQYKIKESRNKAHEILLDKLQMIEENASVDTVKRRIENMRFAYRRELKKVQRSRSNGDVYVPSLWYYGYLTFLDGEEEPINRIEIDPLITEEENEIPETPSKVCRVPASTRKASNIKIKPETVKQECPPSSPALPSVSASTPGVADEPAAAYGRAVGLQLTSMDKMQRCIAEKLISEVVFYGKLDRLTVQSSVTLNNSLIIISPNNYTTSSSSANLNNANSSKS